MPWTLALLAAAASCSGDASPEGRAVSLRLSTAAPETTLAAPGTIGAASQLGFRISKVETDPGKSFVIGTTLAWTEAGKPRTLKLAGVSPFPESQPGVFRVRIPSASREALRKSRDLTLKLSVLPLAADRPLATRLRVSIDSLFWAR